MARAVAPPRPPPRSCDQASLGVRLDRPAHAARPASLLFVLRRAIVGAAAAARRVHGGRRRQHVARPRRVRPRPASGSRCTCSCCAASTPTRTRARRSSSTSGRTSLNIVLAFALVGPYDILGLGAAFAISYARVPRCGRCRCCRTRCPASRSAACSAACGGWSSPAPLAGEATWLVARQRRRQLRRRRASSGSSSAAVVGARRVRRRARSSLARTRAARRCAVLGRAPVRPAAPPSRLGRMFKLVKKWWKYLTAKLTGSFNERADPKVQLEQAITEAQTPAPPAQGAGGQRHRQPEAERAAAQRQDDRAGEAQRQRPPGADHGRRRREGRRRHQGDAVHLGRRDDRQPADPGREGRREPEDDGPRVDPGVRPGQGGGRSRTAGCCRRRSPRSRSCCRSSTRRRCRRR